MNHNSIFLSITAILVFSLAGYAQCPDPYEYPNDNPQRTGQRESYNQA